MRSRPAPSGIHHYPFFTTVPAYYCQCSFGLLFHAPAPFFFVGCSHNNLLLPVPCLSFPLSAALLFFSAAPPLRVPPLPTPYPPPSHPYPHPRSSTSRSAHLWSLVHCALEHARQTQPVEVYLQARWYPRTTDIRCPRTDYVRGRSPRGVRVSVAVRVFTQVSVVFFDSFACPRVQALVALQDVVAEDAFGQDDARAFQLAWVRRTHNPQPTTHYPLPLLPETT